jgi:hypothetical protein
VKHVIVGLEMERRGEFLHAKILNQMHAKKI